jgi:hypothetical protein
MGADSASLLPAYQPTEAPMPDSIHAPTLTELVERYDQICTAYNAAPDADAAETEEAEERFDKKTTALAKAMAASPVTTDPDAALRWVSREILRPKGNPDTLTVYDAAAAMLDNVRAWMSPVARAPAGDARLDAAKQA